jgi:type I restriction enzyme S subunit
MSVENLITDHLDIWTSAIKSKSSSGRGSSKKLELVGIKKLRELILELAVRGKLVPQDPNDEPASKLVERVNQYLCEEISKSELPKLKRDMSVIPPEEFHYQMPANWVWTELQDIFLFTNGKAHEQYITEEDRYVLVNSKFVSNSGEIRKFVTDRLTPLEKGDFAIVMSDVPNGRALARCNLVEKDGTYTLNQRIGGLSTSPELNKNYLLHLLNRHSYMLEYNDGKKQTNLKKIQIMSAPLAIPPLAEQHRIVAKVDDLMALCDQLEAQTEASIDAHKTLVEVLLATLTDAKDADELNDNWQTISQHFDVLFTTQASIDQLKQTILQLAVMGKLVKQNPKDEPASKLLERIATEKQQLIKNGKIKKQKPLPPITEEEKPFELPKGWEWSRVWNVVHTITSGSRDWAKYYAKEGAIFVTMGNLSRGHYQLRMNNLRYVNPPKAGEGKRTRLEENDLLISITGDVGNLGLIPKDFGEAYINQHTAMIRFMPDCQNKYFPELIRSPLAKFQFDAPQRGIKNSFRLGDVGEMSIPIPPTNEQHRIALKVDELMALCDSLKERLNLAQTIQLNLTDAIVEQAL